MVVKLCYSLQNISHVFSIFQINTVVNITFDSLNLVLFKNINKNVIYLSDILDPYWYYESHISSDSIF